MSEIQKIYLQPEHQFVRVQINSDKPSELLLQPAPATTYGPVKSDLEMDTEDLEDFHEMLLETLTYRLPVVGLYGLINKQLIKATFAHSASSDEGPTLYPISLKYLDSNQLVECWTFDGEFSGISGTAASRDDLGENVFDTEIRLLPHQGHGFFLDWQTLLIPMHDPNA